MEPHKEVRTCSVDGCECRYFGKGYCGRHYQRLRSHGRLEGTRPTDWGQRKGHPRYQMWQNALRRIGGIAPEWATFERYLEDTGERPSERHMLCVADASKPLGPSNFQWLLVGRGLPRAPAKGDRCSVGKCRKVAHALGLCHTHHARWLRQGTLDDPAPRVVDAEKRRRKLVAANLRKYGLTAEKYDELLSGQNGVCAICGGPPDPGKPFCVDHCHKTTVVRGLLCGRCNTGIGMLGDSPQTLMRAAVYVGKRK